MYGIIIVEKVKEERTIVDTITINDFETNIYPRLMKKQGILKLGHNKVDLTHVIQWVLFEERTKKVVRRSW